MNHSELQHNLLIQQTTLYRYFVCVWRTSSKISIIDCDCVVGLGIS